MTFRLGFSQTSDGELLVISEALGPEHGRSGLTVTHFEDEGVFLSRLVHSGLPPVETNQIISNVLLVLAGRPLQATWVFLTATEDEFLALGLTSSSLVRTLPPPAGRDFLSEPDIREFLTQAPVPLTMLVGPEHRFSFINPSYLELIERKSMASVLGRTVREVLPELEGQRFFGLLDQVYRTGIPFTGTEIPGQLRHEDQTVADHYFDFVYFPVRDREHRVYGVLCQATDVTERVLARQVSEARELQLYRQWAELEALYRGAPVGMALVDTREYRLLRINEVNAALLGIPQSELVGRKIFDLFPLFRPLREIYQRVAGGEQIPNIQVDIVSSDPCPTTRSLLVAFSPVLDACGCVEAIASIVVGQENVEQPEQRITLRLDAALTDPLTLPDIFRSQLRESAPKLG